MGFFDLFRRRLNYDDLKKIGNEEQIKEKLSKMNLKDLQKICLTKCQDLDTEIKQKDVYVGAILDSLRKSGLMEPPSLDKPVPIEEPAPTPIDETDNTKLFESKPIDLKETEAEPAPMKEDDFVPPAKPGPDMEQKPPAPTGGKRRAKNSRNKKQAKVRGGNGKTKKRKMKK